MSKEKNLNIKLLSFSIILSIILLYGINLYFSRDTKLLGKWHETDTMLTQLDPNYKKMDIEFYKDKMIISGKSLNVEYKYKHEKSEALIFSDGWVLKVSFVDNGEIYTVLSDGRPRRFKKI